MKKIFFAIMLGVFAFVSGNICSAAMPVSEMYLGGFGIGSSYDEMVRVYGEPIDTQREFEGNFSFKYGSSVEVGVINSSIKRIWRIIVTENNGWTTPSGLAVGMNISEVLDWYGNANHTEIGTDKTAYCYFGEMRNNEPSYGFIIVFNKNSGKILKMAVYGGNTGIGFAEGNYYQGIMKEMIE